MEIDSDGDGHVDKQEFLEHMLVNMGKITHAEFHGIMDMFDKLDIDRSGTIGPEDVIVNVPDQMSGANTRMRAADLHEPFLS